MPKLACLRAAYSCLYQAEQRLLACAGQGQLPTNRQPSAEARAKRPAGSTPTADGSPAAAGPSPRETPPSSGETPANAGKQSFVAMGKPSKRMAAALATLPVSAAGLRAPPRQRTAAAPAGAGSERSGPNVQSAGAEPAAYGQALAAAARLQRGIEALAASAAALAPRAQLAGADNLARP